VARILYTVNIPRFFVSHRLPLALAARAAGHDVHVATADTDPVNLARIRDAGLTLHPIPLAQHATSPLGELRTLLALVRLYRRLRPDLLHHVTIKPVLYGGIAARFAGSPPVVAAMSGLGRAFRGDDGRTADVRLPLRAALRFALPGRTTCTVFQNVEDRDAFVRLGLADVDRTTVIRGSGVDPTAFTVAPEPDGLPTVLYAGRLMRQKGLERFVELARVLGGQARFAVAGYPEPSSPDVVPIATVEAWAAEGVIEWLGARDDMPAVYAGASIVVLPTVYGEGVPKTLIEAASCGRAVVTTDIPGCRDVCRDGVNGLLVAPQDDDALRAAVLRLVGDRELRARMGAAGRRMVEEEFSLEHVTSATLALYTELLAAR
jgi:glycosyltransferase involved in cell wall biosynthesis